VCGGGGAGGSGKPRPAVSWKTIERVAARAEREEMEHLLEMSDEEIDAELKEAGFGANDAANVVKAALAKAPAAPGAPAAPATPAAPAMGPAPLGPAKVVSLASERQKRGRAPAPLALVAAAAAVVAAIGGGGAAYVVLRTPEPVPTTPVPTMETAPPSAPPELLAKQDALGLRVHAATECGARRWKACVEDLDFAKKLDPAGDEERSVHRMRSKALRGAISDQMESKPGALTPRSLAADQSARLVESLSARKGQAVSVLCARGAEARRYCGQIVVALMKARWVVTRDDVAADAGAGGVARGLAIDVAADADDATQDAADALADAFERAYMRARGPDDVPAASAEAPLTLTVGPQ
jgi:hypothetical protein